MRSDHLLGCIELGELTIQFRRARQGRVPAILQLRRDQAIRRIDQVVLPSGASDAYGLLKSAIRDNNPVVVFEAGRSDALEEDVEIGDSLVPIGAASVKRPGTDVTVVALGYMVVVALAAAEELTQDGVSVEVIDPRTLVPLDVDTIRQSIRKTGRLVVVDESAPVCSMASEIAAVVAEDWETYRMLRAPVRRLCMPPVPVPFSPPLEDFVLPDQSRIASTVRELVGYA